MLLPSYERYEADSSSKRTIIDLYAYTSLSKC